MITEAQYLVNGRVLLLNCEILLMVAYLHRLIEVLILGISHCPPLSQMFLKPPTYSKSQSRMEIPFFKVACQLPLEFCINQDLSAPDMISVIARVSPSVLVLGSN